MAPKRILIVEDEAITAEVIAEQLESLGYFVAEVVASGSDAIAQAAATQPDLVLMDIRLEGGDIDGVMAATQIREQFEIPVIYLTAHSDRATLERAKVTEPYGYILKPFNERSLRVAIETALYRHNVEQQRAREKEFLEVLLRSISDAVVAVNQSGTVTYMNPAAEQMTGWGLPEAFGENVSDVVQIVDETTGKQAKNPVLEVLETGQVVYMDDHMALVTKSGTQTAVADSASPMTQESNQLVGAVLVMADVSDRRRAAAFEQDAQASQAAEALTRQSLEAEQELSALRNRLIATLAHEYRTPLAIIRSSAELLHVRSTRVSDEQRDNYLEMIQESIKRLNQLVDDVLLYSQAEAGRLPFEPAALLVADFCRELVESQQLLMGDRYRLEYQCESEGVMMHLDANLLWRILTNLISNGVKYSSEGSVVTLTFSRSAQQAIFQVADQGMGIPADAQARLFEPFFRAPGAKSVLGTGMGLSIVQKCVERHDGQISIESTVGIGSVFRVVLPDCTLNL
ncbi:MAG: ATP-binding protein [Elainellaceae cyanobacterium]